MRESAQRFAPEQRPFVLTRSGTAGIQRYAALWTGDNSSWWEHIALGIRMCLSLGLSGVPFTGANIGGFWEPCNGELLVRFAQLGALLPLCWNHNAVRDVPQEPWAFGEPYESAYRQAIDQRYRLLPYLYTLFREAALTGAPVIRPLFYHYPRDHAAYAVEDAFLVGDSLLSAPITISGATSRRVYLPEGIWIDYWNGRRFSGGYTYEIAAPLEQWPLFVRGNSILPSGPPVQYIGQRPVDPLIFTCYMAETGDASFTLYEDDGKSVAYQQGMFAETHVHCQLTAESAIVTINENHERYQPERTAYEIVVQSGENRFQQQVGAGQGNITQEWIMPSR